MLILLSILTHKDSYHDVQPTYMPKSITLATKSILRTPENLPNQVTNRIQANNEEVKVVSSLFQGFSSNGIVFNDAFGGAINTYSNTTIIHACSFIDCYARYCGALAIYESSAHIKFSSFISNYCEFDCGAIWLMSCKESSIEICNFTNNKAGGDFGALASNQTKFIINDCYFFNNTAINGKDLAFTKSSPAMIIRSSFERSESNSIYIEDTQSAIFQCCIFNKASSNIITMLGDVTILIDGSKCSYNAFEIKAKDPSKVENIPFEFIKDKKVFKTRYVNIRKKTKLLKFTSIIFIININ